MARKKVSENSESSSGNKRFRLEFLTETQKFAWNTFQQNDVTFVSGAAGTGKSFLSMAFAINEILQKRRSKIILTRPLVEAGESMGYLPGTVDDKVAPYMLPLYDIMEVILGTEGQQRKIVEDAVEVAPLCFMRGRTLSNAVCIFDEAQNATYGQLKLFLTRFGKNSKVIINGDPTQTDLQSDNIAFVDIMHKLEGLSGVGNVRFKADSIVRHELIGKILSRLEN